MSHSDLELSSFRQSCREQCPDIEEILFSVHRHIPDLTALLAAQPEGQTTVGDSICRLLEEYPVSPSSAIVSTLPYVKLWLIYARCRWDPVHVFETMLRKQVGNRESLFYMEMASHYEFQENR